MTIDTASDQRLRDVSIATILAGQSPSGAYIASPDYPTYHFAWLRDGSYCALAMDAAGERESARRFHDWVASTLTTHSAQIDSIVAALAAGRTLTAEQMLPTRYTLDGLLEAEQEELWPNFQLDGYGTWLFALHSHVGGRLPSELRASVELAVRYLSASWWMPCYDYWEEFGDRQHTSTLAAIAAGLNAASALLGTEEPARIAAEVVDAILETCVSEGRFGKGPDDPRVDASLVSLVTPFQLVPADHPVAVSTVEAIRYELASPSGGIRRYIGDSYYGGSPWFLLTAWLGWHDRLVGNDSGYASSRAWVEQHALPNGELPEQLIAEPQAPEWVEPWTEKWGAVASPLLWSHAKYLLMTTVKGSE